MSRAGGKQGIDDVYKEIRLKSSKPWAMDASYEFHQIDAFTFLMHKMW